MFGLGIWELALIGIVALLVLGPDKLPEAARSLGKALNDFRRAGEDMKREIMDPATPPKPITPATQAPQQTVSREALDVTPPKESAPPAPSGDDKPEKV